MNDTTDDAAAQAAASDGESTDESQRYGAIEMANGDVVIYDQQRPTAWLQADFTVEVEV